MATLIAAATGNFSSAGSWGVADTTSLSLANNSATNVTTSNLDSSTFAPGAITVDGILLNLASRVLSPTGTMTVTLRNSTGGSDVASVTINNADLPAVGGSAVAPGAWLFFKFASSQTLLGATNYVVRVVSSVTSQCQLYSGPSNNWNRALRTTTTGAPAAGDRLFIQREYTAAGTSNALVVTMDNNSTTSFGKIDISTGGTLAFSTSGNTQLRTAGNLDIWAGGELDIGTTGTPVPVGTTAILELDCGSNVQYGLEVRAGGTTSFQGGNKTYWKAFLAADAASSATSLTLDTSVGSNWKNGDEIALASTTRTASQSEKKSLTADGSGTTLTISAITNAHSGTAPIAGEVLNLTRNVKIRPSGAFSSYINLNASAFNDWDWAEFSLLGSATASKRGIDLGVTSTGSFDMQNCSVHDCTVASSRGVNISSSASFANINNNAFYNIASNCILLPALVATTWSISGNVGILNSSGAIYDVADGGGTFTNNTGVSGFAGAFAFSATDAVTGTISGLTAHANGNLGISFATIWRGTISNITAYRNSGNNISFSAVAPGTNSQEPLTLDTATLFGSASDNMGFSGYGNTIYLKNFTIDAGTTLASSVGIGFNAETHCPVYVINSNIGTNQTHATADISFSNGFAQVWLDRVVLGSTTEVSQSAMPYGAFVRSSRHDNVAGAYKAWFRTGRIDNDTSTYRTASPSQRLTPLSTTLKLQSAVKSVAMNSGQTATVTCYVNKSASYNGNQPRLIVKTHYGAGITTDTVLATAVGGTGSWLTLQGTTAAVTEDCVLEFIVDCDGNAGQANVDDWSVTLI